PRPPSALPLHDALPISDTAMYQAKSAGRNTYCFFDAQMNADIRERLGLEQDLRQALVRGEFVLHYQPIVDLQGGRLQGAEALLRDRKSTRLNSSHVKIS